MKHLLLSLCLVFAVSTGAIATTQNTPTEAQKKSQLAQLRISQLDVLVQVVPMVLRKEQFPAILTALEKIRADDQRTFKVEDDEINKLAKELDDTYDLAVKKGVYPSKDLIAKIGKVTRALGIQRQILSSVHVDDLYKVLVGGPATPDSPVQKGVLDAGQQKAVANSLDHKYFGETAKESEISDEKKIKIFIRYILLDPLCYDILVQLQKIAS